MTANCIIATMFFKQGQYGWSESHAWVDGGSDSLKTVMEECISDNGLVFRRTKLLGNNADFQAVRVSRNGVWRDSLFKEALGDSTLLSRAKRLPFGDGSNADSPYSVTTVRMNMTESYRKLIYLSGLPASCQPEPPSPNWPDATIVSAFNSYLHYLANQAKPSTKWGSIVSTKSTTNPPGVNVANPPAAGDYVAGNGSTSTLKLTMTAPPPAVVPGQKIRLLGVKKSSVPGASPVDTRKWNGIFITTAATVGNQITIAVKDYTRQVLPTLDWSGAYVFVPAEQAIKYDDSTWEGQTHRKRGRAFSAPRGRS